MGKPIATRSTARNICSTPNNINPLVLAQKKIASIAASDYQAAYDVLDNVGSQRIPEKRVAKSRWKNGWNAGLAIENENGEFIGWIGFNSPSQGMKQDMGLGYALRPDHWGNGYMSDAVDVLTHYLFQRYPIEKITAPIWWNSGF